MTWIALLRGRLPASLAATTGVEDATDVVKYLLAGADVVMTASAVLRHGPEYAAELIGGLEDWLAANDHATVGEIRGLLRTALGEDAAAKRAAYIDVLRSGTAVRLSHYAAAMPDFGRSLRAEWLLDPDVTYLNHGTVGATPRRVLEHQRAITDEIERQPARFMLRELADSHGTCTASRRACAVAAAAVAEFVGVAGEDLMFVDNITTGANADPALVPVRPRRRDRCHQPRLRRRRQRGDLRDPRDRRHAAHDRAATARRAARRVRRGDRRRSRRRAHGC